MATALPLEPLIVPTNNAALAGWCNIPKGQAQIAKLSTALLHEQF